jgi:hypothetical protein
MSTINEYWQKITHVFSSEKQGAWIDDAYSDLLKHKEEDKLLPFKILSIVEKGFVVRVSGLKAFVSFYHMPWNYNDINAWHVISPTIEGLWFFGKVHEMQRDGNSILIIINAGFPQFRPFEFEKEKEYSAIITGKSTYEVRVDIGHQFNWFYGSFPGKIKVDEIETEYFAAIQPGDEISVYLYNDVNSAYKNCTPEYKNLFWHSEACKELIGKEITVGAIQDELGEIRYVYNSSFSVHLPVLKKYYKGYNRDKVREIISSVQHGAMINCVVTEVNCRKRYVTVRLLIQDELIDERIKKSKKSKKFPLEETCNQVVDGSVEPAQDSSALFQEYAYKNEIAELVGLEVSAKVNRSGIYKNEILIRNRYRGILKFNHQLYRNNYREVRKHFDKLPDNYEIHCRVIGIKEDTQLLICVWLGNHTVNVENRNLIGNLLNKDLIQRLEDFQETKASI